MTQRDEPGGPTMTHDEAVDLVAAYVLDALDAGDRAPFERHLASCATCQHERDELQRVTIGLALGALAVDPPPELKTRVLATAVTGWQAPSSVVPSAPRPAPEPRVSTAGDGRRSMPALRPAPAPASWLPLAASILLAVGLGTYAASLRTRLGYAEQTVAEIAGRLESTRDQLASERLHVARLANTVNVLGAPDIIKVDLRGQADAPAAVGRAYISASRGMVFETEQMPVLPSGKVYQLWVIPPDKTPVSAGVFNVAPNGTYALMRPLPEGVTATKIIAVTIEDGPNGVVQSKNAPVLVGEAGQ